MMVIDLIEILKAKGWIHAFLFYGFNKIFLWVISQGDKVKSQDLLFLFQHLQTPCPNNTIFFLFVYEMCMVLKKG